MCIHDSSLDLPATKMQLMRPGSGQTTSCRVDDIAQYLTLGWGKCSSYTQAMAGPIKLANSKLSTPQGWDVVHWWFMYKLALLHIFIPDNLLPQTNKQTNKQTNTKQIKMSCCIARMILRYIYTDTHRLGGDRVYHNHEKVLTGAPQKPMRGTFPSSRWRVRVMAENTYPNSCCTSTGSFNLCVWTRGHLMCCILL